MREREPMTQTMNTSDASRAFEKIVEQVSKQQARIVVEEDGTPVAAIISAKDLQELQRMEQQREAAFGVIDRMRAAFADVPEDEIERQVDDAIAEVRAERRAQDARHTPK